MTLNYTTKWVRKKIQTLEQWNYWVQSLHNRDRVLVQQFIPRGNSCLESQVECWRFWEGIYAVNRVIYNDDSHPLKDGYCVYWNSDEKWGQVFGARIVPWHSDVAPREGFHFRDCHAPIFEPAWATERHYVFVPHGKIHHKAYHELRKRFPHCYGRRVNEGELVTIFGEDFLAGELESIDSIRYLYSEPLDY